MRSASPDLDGDCTPDNAPASPRSSHPRRPPPPLPAGQVGRNSSASTSTEIAYLTVRSSYHKKQREADGDFGDDSSPPSSPGSRALRPTAEAVFAADTAGTSPARNANSLPARLHLRHSVAPGTKPTLLLVKVQFDEIPAAPKKLQVVLKADEYTTVREALDQLKSKYHTYIDQEAFYGLCKMERTGPLWLVQNARLSKYLHGTDADSVLMFRLQRESLPANLLRIVLVPVNISRQLITRTVKIDENTSVRDIMVFLTKKNPVEDISDFGIYDAATAQWLQNDMLFSPANLKLFSHDALEFRMQRLEVLLMLPSKEERAVVFPPQISVRDAFLMILKSKPALVGNNRPEDFGLFFLEKGNSPGLLMEFDRTVYSYRLRKNKDKLALALIPDDLIKHSRASLNRANVLFLIIDSPAHGMAKTFRFCSSQTIGEVFQEFVDKHPVTLTAERYRLYSQGSVNLPLEMSRTLESFDFKNLDTLIFKEHGISEPPAVPANAVFGVDPSQLIQTFDDGYMLPTVLYSLSKALLVKGGLESPGVLRVAGSEASMKAMQNCLNNNLPLESIQSQFTCHDAAALIKMWFKQLPTRLFGPLLPTEIQSAASNQERSILLVDKLPDQENLLFIWLLDLLVEVAARKDVNHMGPEELGAVMGPLLVDISQMSDQAESALKLAMDVSAVVCHLICYQLHAAHGIVHEPKPAPAPDLSGALDSRR